MAFIIMAGVTYYIFSPVFKGYTLSDVAGVQNNFYPWAYQPTEQSAAIHDDQADLLYPWQVLLHGALKTGDFPLWDPYSFAGHPFFANGANMILYPPRVFLSLVTTPTKAHDLLLLSHMLLGGLTMFLLLSDVRLSFGASLFGGISWMLNSFMLAWMPLEFFVVIEAWMPLAFLLMRRTLNDRSWPLGIWLGIVMALIFFGGHLLLIEFTFAGIACYGGYLLCRDLRGDGSITSGVKLRRVVHRGTILAIPAVVLAGLMQNTFRDSEFYYAYWIALALLLLEGMSAEKDYIKS